MLPSRSILCLCLSIFSDPACTGVSGRDTILQSYNANRSIDAHNEGASVYATNVFRVVFLFGEARTLFSEFLCGREADTAEVTVEVLLAQVQ
jgi:hypothetical protein